MSLDTIDISPRRGSGIMDLLWERVRQEAEEALGREPILAPLFVGTILQQRCFEHAVLHRIAARLSEDTLRAGMLFGVFCHALEIDPGLGEAFRADIVAIIDRDPACHRLIEPLLYFKGFHAIQAHRIGHWLWNNHRVDLALLLQSLSSQTFQTDIHPAARFGYGIFLDHATGLVAGATSVVEGDVSILQAVTLGGTGKEQGDRHPKVRRGVLIGAGATILGNIEIGNCARIAAGSVVIQPVPPHSTVAGVPARVVGTAGCAEPARSMDQILDELSMPRSPARSDEPFRRRQATPGEPAVVREHVHHCQRRGPSRYARPLRRQT
jgi:serine O-acetyltransferase